MNNLVEILECVICAAWLLLPVAVALVCERIDGRRAGAKSAKKRRGEMPLFEHGKAKRA